MATVPPGPAGRTRPTETGGELEMLTQMLDFLRSTVVLKVSGLTEEQARTAAVASSSITPVGLVHHLMATERWWFALDFAGLDGVPAPYDADAGEDGFDAGDLTLPEVVALYEAECARSREVVAAAALDDLAAQPPFGPFTLRYALLHMVEETARHCGHLDLVREAVDGSRGQ